MVSQLRSNRVATIPWLAFQAKAIVKKGGSYTVIILLLRKNALLNIHYCTIPGSNLHIYVTSFSLEAGLSGIGPHSKFGFICTTENIPLYIYLGTYMQTEQLDYSDVLCLCSPQLLPQEGAVQSP